jgi:hypothetical protein
MTEPKDSGSTGHLTGVCPGAALGGPFVSIRCQRDQWLAAVRSVEI